MIYAIIDSLLSVKFLTEQNIRKSHSKYVSGRFCKSVGQQQLKTVIFHHAYVSFSDIPRLESRIARDPVLARRPFPVLKHPPRF